MWLILKVSGSITVIIFMSQAQWYLGGFLSIQVPVISLLASSLFVSIFSCLGEMA